MSSKRFPLVGGRVMRLTRLDSCGRVAFGDRARIVSDGFVSIAATANYDDGTEVSVTNAAGRRCVQRDADPELLNYTLVITFCDVDPDLYTAFTGYPRIVDPATGETIGFKVNRGIRPSATRNALETWSDAQGNAGCEDDAEVPYGYLLWPFLTGGRPGDYTIENGAVSFSVSAVVTKDGSAWDVGPYEVVRDAAGDPDTLAGLGEAIEALDHKLVVRTTVAPPAETDGLVPLDDPETAAATEATAGAPGTWDGVRPADFAALDASAITADPATAWTPGQHVILGDGSYAHWTSTDWAAGKAD